MKALHQFHSLPRCEAGDFYVYPRTVVEAYPTHQSHQVCTKYEPMQPVDKVITAVCLVAAIVVMVLI